ncbi:MAG: FAD-binding oxidoreductase [Sphingomonas sp.]
MAAPSSSLLASLLDLLGPKGFTSDADDMAPWLADWRGRWHGRAAAMLSPASTGEVAAALRLCSEAGVPLVPQGGNTSMVGGATPDGSGDSLLLSLRRMNRIRALDAQADLAICEAGVILADLHAAAQAAGWRFPLTLGAKGSATIGGLVSTNAGGTQVLRHGTMRRLVLGLEAVLPDGSVFDGLAALKKDNRGYDLTQLLIGAEGTLGVVTAASLKLVPAIGSRAVAWVGVETPATALELLHRLEATQREAIESFELIPRSALDLVLAHIPGTRPPLAGPAPWNVLIETISPMATPGPEPLLYEGLRSAHEAGVILDAAIAASEVQAETFWRLRESIAEAEKADGPAAKHDISVAVADMPRFLVDGGAAVEERFPGTAMNAFGHLGDGNIHFNVRAPEGVGPDWVEGDGATVSRFVHDLVTEAGGSISAEHGIGQMKRDELARLGGDARMGALGAIKRALDPKGIMNPGKLVPSFDNEQDRLAENGAPS